MTQAVNFGEDYSSTGKTQKSYVVSFKGLIVHALDVLRTKQKGKLMLSMSDLPDLIKRDIGLLR
ncbi:hypothetical protein [Enterovibrio nigricans]|uniref:Uncharacterized protein n=1 Tax=Enterovibrio nigricans DSM 22720 TaxID=1121868 RepID=A0A1T4VSC5_9GAMM|nr:hypothetical protein [Enterovibrio nigricans]PKF48983.1 hypothetical protein AT251_22220 [Enterovibrio nigricans]SKA67745.1 hypothetical protein SAMN02745132_04231 [Enterovibrio nigricans DSM 22720]